jgi:hypothetical protein
MPVLDSKICHELYQRAGLFTLTSGYEIQPEINKEE